MLVFRLVFGLLLLAAILCFATYAATGQPRWRALGLRIVRWTVAAGLGFFAVLLLERLTPLL